MTRGVATLTLNRPEVANAYDEDLLRAMTAALEMIAHDDAVRALVIRGAGKHFQAGADINWLNRLSRQGPEENYAASIVTVRFSKTLNELPKPTIAVIHGACFGGGVGIACCVDVALATPDALFAISEVRHGIAPTPISTHMVNAIGLRQTRRYALTGERFGAEEAARIGLVHEVVATERMEARLAEVLDAIVLGAPGAIARTKLSFLGANGLLLGEREVELLAHEGWMQRQSAEGQEGTTAFREKRRPGVVQWRQSRDMTPPLHAMRERSRRVSGAGEGATHILSSSAATANSSSWSNEQARDLTAASDRSRKNSFGDCSVIAALRAINSGGSIPLGRSLPTSPASNFILWWRHDGGQHAESAYDDWRTAAGSRRLACRAVLEQ